MTPLDDIRVQVVPHVAENGVVLVRQEQAADVDMIRTITREAFGRELEATMVDQLRESHAWIPSLSLVALDGTEIVGHVVCTRATIEGNPVLGLGPISVRPDRQRDGVGKALMHTVLGAADGLGEPLVGLLGDPAYYERFGFRTSTEFGILPQDAQWGRYFQARPLTAYREMPGVFVYPLEFDVD